MLGWRGHRPGIGSLSCLDLLLRLLLFSYYTWVTFQWPALGIGQCKASLTSKHREVPQRNACILLDVVALACTSSVSTSIPTSGTCYVQRLQKMAAHHADSVCGVFKRPLWWRCEVQAFHFHIPNPWLWCFENLKDVSFYIFLSLKFFPKLGQ